MALSLKVILSIVSISGIMGFIVIGAFVMNSPLLMEGEGIIISNSLFQTVPRDDVLINDVSILNNKLVINISYSGGCKDHFFKLVASDSWLESYPVQTPILLSHDANNDNCEAFLTETLSFNLQPLKERYKELYKENSATIVLLIEGGTENFTVNYSF
jgi:hypothetical protein